MVSCISIHAPLAGCDSHVNMRVHGIRISIHAPLAGCDASLIAKSSSLANFNPRTPCGVRRYPAKNKRDTLSISIHAPLAGCDDRCYQSFYWCTISIHAPLAGCDDAQKASVQVVVISIHAPLAGCDEKQFICCCIDTYFNPRTPCGVRPWSKWNMQREQSISIHAPLAGCDSKIAEIFPANLRKSYKISAKPNKERRCHVLGKGKAAAISDLARCEPPGENRNTSGSHQIMSAPSGA